MKKTLSLILCAMMLFTCLPSLAVQTEGTETHTLEKKAFPLYAPSGKLPVVLELVFADGADDLPFVDLPDFVDMLNFIMQDPTGTLYQGNYDSEEDSYTLVYTPLQSDVLISFDSQSILFSNFETFGGEPDQALMDSLSASGFNAETGEPELFSRVSNLMMDRAGSLQVINLKDYSIPMIRQDGLLLLPLQTLYDLLVGMKNGSCVYFNGEGIFIGISSMFAKATRDPETGDISYVASDVGEAYFGAEKKQRSEAARLFGISEFCMVMDHFYGLKDAHNIKSFAQLLVDTNYYIRMLDPDPKVADEALNDLINFYLDDLHSAFKLNSWGTGLNTELAQNGFGFSRMADSRNQAMYDEARISYYPDGIPGYEEVGNTAYVTFDSFVVEDNVDYYNLNLDDPACIQDTLSLIMYANHQIQRENSPIENVVMDLSNNGGGMVDAAVFVLGWYLGVAPITTVSTFTGAQSTSMYRVDTNLDRQFDNDDTLLGKYRLFCLTSPLSFSCGNLVPWVFKASGNVTLVGDTTGGGSCMVRHMSTAWGASFQTSSHYRLAFIKNGSFYDVDRGVEPDVVLTKLSSFYDRAKLTDILNRLD